MYSDGNHVTPAPGGVLSARPAIGIELRTGRFSKNQVVE